MQGMETSEGFKSKPKLARTMKEKQNDYPRILGNQYQSDREVEPNYIINEEDFFRLSKEQNKSAKEVKPIEKKVDFWM